jgi:hypothetical protein
MKSSVEQSDPEADSVPVVIAKPSPGNTHDGAASAVLKLSYVPDEGPTPL